MTKLLLSFLNAPALLIIVAWGIGLQTTLFQGGIVAYFQPDVVLIATLWFALRRSFTEGGILTLVAAYLTELHTAAPRGLFLILYLTVFFVIRGASRYIVLQGRTRHTLVTLLFSGLTKIYIIAILSSLGVDTLGQWRHFASFAIPTAIGNGMLAYWAFHWLDRFDWVTYKNPRARRAIEDELELTDEGL